MVEEQTQDFVAENQDPKLDTQPDPTPPWEADDENEDYDDTEEATV